MLVTMALPPLALYHAIPTRSSTRRTSTITTITFEIIILVFISPMVVPVPPSSSKNIFSNIGRILPTKTKRITAIMPRSMVG